MNIVLWSFPPKHQLQRSQQRQECNSMQFLAFLHVSPQDRNPSCFHFKPKTHNAWIPTVSTPGKSITFQLLSQLSDLKQGLFADRSCHCLFSKAREIWKRLVGHCSLCRAGCETRNNSDRIVVESQTCLGAVGKISKQESTKGRFQQVVDVHRPWCTLPYPDTHSIAISYKYILYMFTKSFRYLKWRYWTL